MADGKATTTKSTFSRETTVSIEINATPENVWSLITDISKIPSWTSQVLSIEGTIQVGETIKLVSALDEKRVFKLKVKECVPNEHLRWGDSQGNRSYLIKPKGDGVVFTMTEKIGGLMFPLYAKYIPPFDESFEAYAADLKKQAESVG